jgi:putative ABC transport system substrate-binding protein
MAVYLAALEPRAVQRGTGLPHDFDARQVPDMLSRKLMALNQVPAARLGCALALLVLIAGNAGAAAREPGKVFRIGWLGGGITGYEHRQLPAVKEFTEGLRQLGYAEGKNIIIEAFTVGPDKIDQYSEFAARLVGDRVDVILASNPHATAAVTKATRRIPVVAIDLESDPVARGWAASLARPGANVTGFFLDIPAMSGKHIQFLREVKPELARVAVIGDPRINELQFQATESAARKAGLVIQRFPARSQRDLDAAIAEAARQGAGGLVVLSSPLVNSSLKRIADHAIKHRLLSICMFTPRFAEAGGLLAYGPVLEDFRSRAHIYVVRILQGTKAGDLPIQRPETFQLVVNLKTAQALQLSVPQSLLLRVDQVIGSPSQ